MAVEVVTLARAESAVGEVALRRRGDVVELVVNGVFAMDTVDTSSERTLASAALARHPAPERVLVGGLGLGFTTRTVLADGRVRHVDVVEIAEPLVHWCRDGVVPELAGIAADGRVRLHVGDVADVLADAGGVGWDVVLLDVDNGPGFLVCEANARLYDTEGLATAYRRLRAGGILAVWSAHRSGGLHAALSAASGGAAAAEETTTRVERNGHTLDYTVYTLARPPERIWPPRGEPVA